MQLEKGEHSILAYFGSSEEAQKAVRQLKDSGLVNESQNMQIDRISRYRVTNDAHYNSPMHNALTLSGITLYSEKEGEGNSPLLAASDSASGLGNPGAGAAGGGAFLVTVVLSQENISPAVKLLKENGGYV